MVRDGQLIRNRADEYCLTRHLDVVTGKVLAHRDGFGFLRPDDGSDDVYLSAREMHILWDGDRVAIRANDTSRGREGHVVEILARGKTRIVGHLRRERGIDSVHEEGDGHTEVLIARDETTARSPATSWSSTSSIPEQAGHAVGRVTQIVGRKDQRGIETDVAILAHGIPNEWPPRRSPKPARSAEVPEKAKKGREDLRSLRSSRSTARTREISTTRSTASRKATAGGCSSRSPMLAITCRRTRRSIARRAAAARRSTSPTASCRCCRRSFRTVCAR